MNAYHFPISTDQTKEERYRLALEEILNHWANSYDAPQFGKDAGSSYVIGVVDGHRLCTLIARKALNDDNQ